MHILVFGFQGWIGQQFLANTTHTVVAAQTRPEHLEAATQEILAVKPDAVCSFLGRTHGPGAPTIDYLEQPGRLRENMRDNYIAPMHLAQICEAQGIQFVYLGTGCIFSYTDEKHTFTEEDVPNFFGSSYSIIKGYTDQEIRRFSTTLQLRIRMPIAAAVSGRNFIDKIARYPNICSIPNSMTVLDDMWVILDRMIEKRVTGTFNLVNPGLIEHNWILEQYRDLLKPSHTWNSVSYDEQMKFITSHRSNNELATTKLEAFCAAEGLPLPNIKDSVMRCLRARLLN
jgi:dTDP-4-dehydrorhamnose reductase